MKGGADRPGRIHPPDLPKDRGLTAVTAAIFAISLAALGFGCWMLYLVVMHYAGH